MARDKPIPVQGIHTRPFWEGTKAGRLMLPRCEDCGRVHWYPRHICPYCHSVRLAWTEASGLGKIYTFAVQHLAFGPFAKDAPFVTAYIDLREGVRMLTVLRGLDPLKPEEIRTGAEVQVEFEQADENSFIPFWRVLEN